MTGLSNEEYADTLAIADRMELRRLELDKEREKDEMQQRYALRREEESTKRSRHEMLVWIFGVLFVVAGIIAFTYIMWLANRGPSAADEIDQQFKVECVQAGSTYVDGQCIGRDVRISDNPEYEEPSS